MENETIQQGARLIEQLRALWQRLFGPHNERAQSFGQLYEQVNNLLWPMELCGRPYVEDGQTFAFASDAGRGSASRDRGRGRVMLGTPVEVEQMFVAANAVRFCLFAWRTARRVVCGGSAAVTNSVGEIEVGRCSTTFRTPRTEGILPGLLPP
jgi:hypothetical protein